MSRNQAGLPGHGSVTSTLWIGRHKNPSPGTEPLGAAQVTSTPTDEEKSLRGVSMKVGQVPRESVGSVTSKALPNQAGGSTRSRPLQPKPAGPTTAL